MNIREIPRGQLSTIILSTMLSGDKYGYEIIKDIEERFGITIKQPSLYSSLSRMENQKLVSSYWRDSELGGKRHYYSLTDYGRKQTEQWQTDLILSLSTPKKPNDENQNLEKDSVEEKPTFLQQENLFSSFKQAEIKENPENIEISESSLPDQLDMFSIKKEEMQKEEPVLVTETFISPPEKKYDVYKDLTSLRNKANNTFIEQQSEDEEVKTAIFLTKDEKETEAFIYKGVETNKEDLGSESVKEDEKISFPESETQENLEIVEEKNDIKIGVNKIQDITETTTSPISHSIYLMEEKQEIIKPQKEQIKDDAIFITETPDPESLPKVKKIQPASINIVAESSFLKYSAPETKYNELVNALYEKGLTDKNADGYLSYETLKEHYKSSNIKFYPYQTKEITTHNAKQVRTNNNEFVPINKVKMIKSLIMFILIMLETWLTYALIRAFSGNAITWLYILVSVFALLPTLYFAFTNYKNPDKQIEKEVIDFKQLWLNLGIMIVGILLIYAINVLFGLNAETLSFHATTLFLPIVLLFNLPLNFFITRKIISKF